MIILHLYFEEFYPQQIDILQQLVYLYDIIDIFDCIIIRQIEYLPSSNIYRQQYLPNFNEYFFASFSIIV